MVLNQQQKKTNSVAAVLLAMHECVRAKTLTKRFFATFAMNHLPKVLQT